LPVWAHNVLQLAAGSRSAILPQVLSWDFLVRPIHDYYGPLLIPQVGLAGVVISFAALAGCWPGRAGADRWLVPLAVGLAASAGAALLATNFEIAWIGWSAWLVLISGVWLGFACGGRRGIFLGGLILPALVIGIAAWWSAWLGQRSQFGYSSALRGEYRAMEGIAPYGSLAGLRLPPELAESLAVMGQSMPDPEPDGKWPVFYGSGMDWLERYFPTQREKGKPLWVHWNTTYDSRQLAVLREKLANPDGYRIVFATIARDEWPPELREVLDKYFMIDLVGPVVRRWTRRDLDSVDFSDSLAVLAGLGGNVDGRALHFDEYPLAPRRTADGRLMLGTTRRAGQVLLTAPTLRLQGVAVLGRLPGAAPGPLAADFKIIVHGATPENIRWAEHVELPAGQQSIAVPFALDGGGQRLLLWVTRPENSPAGGLAGYRELEINHAVDAGGAPQLRNGVPAEVPSSPEMAGSLFGQIAWRPAQLVVRGGRAADTGLELPAGGEVWLHTPNMTGEVRGKFICPSTTGRRPTVRVFWYKGGRLQIMQQGIVPDGQTFEFHAWTAEPGGWIGATVDAGDETAPVIVRIEHCTLVP
ncbi:MAG: hypothetical protein JWQ62_1490, partial [Lacunisphaera sp.]|nr:hypothetical protein [Lacunisphaera sp.]